MCVTNIYIDRYPDGKEISFQQTQYCQYGAPGRPCQKHSTLSNPVRKIQFNEPTTEFIMTAPHPAPHPHRVQFPATPPRSRGGSHPRDRDLTPPGEGRVFRQHSKRLSAAALPGAKAPYREHRKERIVIVDSPPTPRTPPMHFTQTFTAPSSPATPPFIVDELPRRERGRPIIVDERPMRRERDRDSSTSAVISERVINLPNRRRVRSQDRGVFQWDSPSSSHTSFDSRARREAEEADRRERERREDAERRERERREDAERRERERKDRERDERIAVLEAETRRNAVLEAETRRTLEAERRKEQRIREQDEEIRRRPAVPIPPNPLRRRDTTRASPPIVDQPRLSISVRETGRDGSAGARVTIPMTAGELALAEEAEIRRRMAERDREAKREREKKLEDEAMVQRLRERQMPKRRFSVAAGQRRTRVLYDDGVYRWE